MNNQLLNCEEPARTDIEFGIRDGARLGDKAYTLLDQPNTWVATVKNQQQKEVTFTPIDNCVIFLQPNGFDKESTCDGMLTFENSVYLVELKAVTKNYINRAKDQLSSTIHLLQKENCFEAFKKRKAYACNKKGAKFNIIEQSVKESFKNENFGFVLHTGNEIKL